MRARSLLLIAALIGSPLPAYGQQAREPSAAELQAATKKFRDAQKKYDHKDYAEALELARAALEVSGSPNARLYVARSLRELGRHAEAYEEMSLTLRESTEKAQTEPKYVPTRDAAAAELAILQRKVGRVIIAIADPPADASVEMNGEPIATDHLGQPIAVMPGEIVVRAKAQGVPSVERKLQIGAGDTRTIALSFDDREATEASPTAPTDAPSPPPRSEPKTSGGTLRTVGFVTAGVGVVGLAVFGVTGYMAKGEFDTLEEECGGERCTDPKYADTVDRGKRYQTIANVGLIVGAVGLVAGGTMILLGGPKQEQGAALSVSPAGLELGYRGRF